MDTETTTYIKECAQNFVEDLYKLEYLDPTSARTQFYQLVKDYDDMFIDKFSEMIDNTDLLDQIREMENPNMNRNEPLAKNSIIPDGRMNPNISKIGTNTMKSGFGMSMTQPVIANNFNQAMYAKPPMDGPLPNRQNQNSSLGNTRSYDIHANSKHYFPQDAEYLMNDYINKPGANFNTNKQAVLMKQRNKDKDVDPMLRQLRDNVSRANKNPQFNPMNQNFGNAGYAGYNPSNNQPVSGNHNLLFNPQIGNNRFERDENLQRNIEMLGGLESTLDFMGKSLTENEMRNMGQATMNLPNQNMGGGFQQHNNQMQFHNQRQQGSQGSGFLGLNTMGNQNLLQTQNIPAGQGFSNFGNSQFSAQGRRLNPHDPYQKPPTSKIELSKMMRNQREEKMMQQQKMQLKFQNFNKMLKEGSKDVFQPEL